MDPSSAPTSSDIGSTATDLPTLGRPLNSTERELLAQLDRLKFFLATAPSRWSNQGNNTQQQPHSAVANQASHPALNRFLLPSGEYVSCVLWAGLYHITGTDIVRALVFRFEAFGRPVINMKKFEEGVFSDLRNLKPGTDACLEEPKSPFLDLLFKFQCIRTQKKQKVFYWFSVPHDRLFLDALERDLKREKMGMESTTGPRGEPALSFTYDPKRSLYEQFLQKNGAGDDESEDTAAVPSSSNNASGYNGRNGVLSVVSPADVLSQRVAQSQAFKQEDGADAVPASANAPSSTPFLSMFSLFEGSPTYKQRRKKTVAGPKRRSTLGLGVISGPGIVLGRDPSMHQQHHPSVIQHHPGPVQHGHHHPSIRQSTYPPQNQLPSYGLSMNPNVESTGPWTAEPLQGTSLHPSLDQARSNAEHSEGGAMSNGNQSPGLKIRAFSCPLLSCRLLFRRAEHLKRHVRSHGMNLGRTGAPNGQFACERHGCNKRFNRMENLRLHMSACTGGNGAVLTPSTSEGEDEGDMEFEAEKYEVEVTGQVHFEDDNASDSVPSPHPPSSAHGPRHLALYTDGMQQLAYAPPRSASVASDGGYYTAATSNGTQPMGSNAHQFAHVINTSAESSPFVETPDGGVNQWPRVTYTIQQKPHYNPPLSSSGSAPPSSHGSFHNHPARYDSPDVNLYPPHPHSAHPSSAPSHKATFDHGSLYPPTYPHHPLQAGGMMGLSLRRHRSATPNMGGGGVARPGLEHVRAQQMQNHSRPVSSAGGDSNYGSTVGAVNGGGHPFAYSVDNADGRGSLGHGSDHSSPLSYGNVIHGEYDVNGGSPLGSAGAGSPGSALGMAQNMVQHTGATSEHQVMQQYVDLDRFTENGEAAAYASGYIQPPASVSSYHDESPYLHSEPNAGGSYHSASPETTSPEEMEMYKYVGNGEPVDLHHPHAHLQQQYHPSQHQQLAPMHQPQLNAYAYS